MKDYLNITERENLIRIVHLASDAERCLEGNALSKEEIGNLKRAGTFAMKAVTSVLNRINPTALKTFKRSAKGSKISLDTYGDREIDLRKRESDYKAAYEENKYYFKLIELIFDNNCKDCTRKGCDCDIYKEFEINNVPVLDQEDACQNCKFAFRSDFIENSRRNNKQST
jgi:hypothetical protein